MGMRAWFFSENAYHLLPDAREYDSIRVKLPNRHYDPKIGADLYHRFIDEWKTAEDLGLEIMVNEHHQTATNLNPGGPIVMGILARETRRPGCSSSAIPSPTGASPCAWPRRWPWSTSTRAAASNAASCAACPTRCRRAIIAPRA